LPLFGSTLARSPRPESSTHSTPALSLGECGIDNSSVTTRSFSTSIRMPPSCRRSRQPSTTSQRDTAVTYLGAPFCMASPFK
jgi:hypothetical protein